MGKMVIAIGLGKPGKGESESEELSEYEQGAQDMRDRACALAEMYESGKRPSKPLYKLIDRLPLDEREEEGPASKPSGKGMDANEAYGDEDGD